MLDNPWNKVYSKLSGRLDRSTMAGQHVLTHVWDYVERHVELIDGTASHSKPYWIAHRRLDSHYRDKFYVHPETGILCAAEKMPRKWKQTQPRRDLVILNDYHQYHQLNEIWYLITFEKFPSSPGELAMDVLQGLISHTNARAVKEQKVYAASKRQCNKKEIRFIMNQLSKL